MNNEYLVEDEIDLWGIIRELWKNAYLIILLMILGGTSMFLYTDYTGVRSYWSTSKIYVLSKQDDSTKLNAYDLQTSAILSEDYIELVKTQPVLDATITELDLDVSYETLAGMVYVNTVENGRIMTISAMGLSPIKAKKLTDCIVKNAAKNIQKITDVKAVNVIEKGTIPLFQATPNYRKNCLLGIAAALILSVGIICISYIFNNKVKYTDDLEKIFGVSVLGMIPMETEKERKSMKKR